MARFPATTSMNSPRVRFAPSPTGYLHVGGARTALFNFLFARRHGGCFILRIEDTDRERSSAEHVRGILDGMSWLGLTWDEGPFYQSAGYERHRGDALRLVRAGQAYHSFVTPEEVEAERHAAEATGVPFRLERQRLEASTEEVAQRHARGESSCVRFIVPSGTTEWDDLIHGPTRFDNAEIEDLVLLRADGSPTYNLSVVSDDIAMRVSHVVRGDDHISNTPKQILLYRALGAEPPRFGHLPLILGADKKRLSKRHGATSVLAYRDMGIQPEAMLNFLALLGWSPGGDRELMDLQQLIATFSWDGVGSSSAVFDLDKLQWMSSEWLKRVEAAQLIEPVARQLSAAGIDTTHDSSALVRYIELARQRARTLIDLAAAVRRYVDDEVQYEPEAVSKHLGVDRLDEHLAALRHAWSGQADWSAAALETTLRQVAELRGLAAGKLIHPTRVAVLGVAVSPGIFDVLSALGRSKTLPRIERLEAALRRGLTSPAP